MSDHRPRILIQEDLNFQRVYRVLAQRWFWLPLAVVTGGLVGLVASFALSSAYRATASLGIAIDYSRTHPLDPAAERSALLQAQELLLADETLSEVIDRAPGEVLERSEISHPSELRSRIRLDRFENRWELSVSARRSVDAAVLANTWAQVGIERLRSALEHAVRARELQTRVYELGCDLEAFEGGEWALWRCEAGDPAEAEGLPEQLLEEVRASHGVLPGLTFAQLREAAPPGEPIYRGRTAMLLGGVLLGLAAGLLLMILWPVAWT